jgi:peptidoglycan/LPS O-acetylase OafA/YrhL
MRRRSPREQILAEKSPIPSLTGFRFLAAATIVWSHSLADIAAPDGWLMDTGRLGTAGMTLFFVLSGFVIHYNYGDDVAGFRLRGLRAFGVARLARLYPLYFLMLCFDFAVRLRHPFDANAFHIVWPYYLTLTQSWFPIKIGDTRLAVVYLGLAWSISTEVLLYLFYLTIAWALCGLRSSRSVAVALVGFFVAAMVFYGGHAMGWWLTGGDQYWGFYLSPYCRIPEFVLGVLTASLYQRGFAERAPARVGRAGAVLLTASLAWLCSIYVLAYHPRFGAVFLELQQSWGFAPGLAGLLYFFARYRSRASLLVENRPVLALGDASYSLYLLHGYALATIRDFAPDSGNWWLLAARTILGWGFAALVALLCYRYYEMPARRMVRRALGGRDTRPLAARRLGGLA